MISVSAPLYQNRLETELRRRLLLDLRDSACGYRAEFVTAAGKFVLQAQQYRDEPEKRYLMLFYAEREEDAPRNYVAYQTEYFPVDYSRIISALFHRLGNRYEQASPYGVSLAELFPPT